MTSYGELLGGRVLGTKARKEGQSWAMSDLESYGKKYEVSAFHNGKALEGFNASNEKTSFAF